MTVPYSILRWTYMVVGPQSCGTGLIAKAGYKVYLFTAWHLAEKAVRDEMTVHLDSGQETPLVLPVGEPIRPTSGDRDICAVPTVAIPAASPGLIDIDPNVTIGFGDEVRLLGYPRRSTARIQAQGNDPRGMAYVKRGLVSSWNRDRTELYIDGLQGPGFSGGPLIAEINREMKVIGIHTAARTEVCDVEGPAGTTDALKTRVPSGLGVSEDIRGFVQELITEDQADLMQQIFGGGTRGTSGGGAAPAGIAGIGTGAWSYSVADYLMNPNLMRKIMEDAKKNG